MTISLLDRKELSALTGRERKTHQTAWLRARGWRYEWMWTAGR